MAELIETEQEYVIKLDKLVNVSYLLLLELYIMIIIIMLLLLLGLFKRNEK